jgi:hypothetical protein
MAEGPFHRAGARRRRVEAAGSTEAAVLAQLARDLAALPASVPALPSTGADARARRSWRRYLRNPYRLPVHGRHFFLLPESWYDEQEDQRRPDLGSLLMWGVHGRNFVLAGLDFGLTFLSPVVLVLALLQACGV